jgi:hypothetical protein
MVSVSFAKAIAETPSAGCARYLELVHYHPDAFSDAAADQQLAATTLETRLRSDRTRIERTYSEPEIAAIVTQYQLQELFNSGVLHLATYRALTQRYGKRSAVRSALRNFATIARPEDRMKVADDIVVQLLQLLPETISEKNVGQVDLEAYRMGMSPQIYARINRTLDEFRESDPSFYRLRAAVYAHLYLGFEDFQTRVLAQGSWRARIGHHFSARRSFSSPEVHEPQSLENFLAGKETVYEDGDLQRFLNSVNLPSKTFFLMTQLGNLSMEQLTWALKADFFDRLPRPLQTYLRDTAEKWTEIRNLAAEISQLKLEMVFPPRSAAFKKAVELVRGLLEKPWTSEKLAELSVIFSTAGPMLSNLELLELCREYVALASKNPQAMNLSAEVVFEMRKVFDSREILRNELQNLFNEIRIGVASNEYIPGYSATLVLEIVDSPWGRVGFILRNIELLGRKSLILTASDLRAFTKELEKTDFFTGEAFLMTVEAFLTVFKNSTNTLWRFGVNEEFYKEFQEAVSSFRSLSANYELNPATLSRLALMAEEIDKLIEKTGLTNVERVKVRTQFEQPWGKPKAEVSANSTGTPINAKPEAPAPTKDDPETRLSLISEKETELRQLLSGILNGEAASPFSPRVPSILRRLLQ